METNWKGNRTQKIYKRDLAKHIVGFNEACENRSIVDYQIKLNCTQNSPSSSTQMISHGGKVCGTRLHTAVQDNINKQTIKKRKKKRRRQE